MCKVTLTDIAESNPPHTRAYWNGSELMKSTMSLLAGAIHVRGHLVPKSGTTTTRLSPAMKERMNV